MKKQKIPAGIIFLAIVTIIYALTGLINANLFLNSLHKFADILKSVVPILLFVFVVLFVINYFINPKKIERHLGETSGIKGWVYTLVASAVISIPPYVLYPVLGDLKKHGMKNSLIAAFMYNRNVQIAFIPAMIYYFGWLYTCVFAFYIIVFSVISGIVVGKFASDQSSD